MMMIHGQERGPRYTVHSSPANDRSVQQGAENLEEACKKGISDDIDWDTQEMDSDSARATTITGAKRSWNRSRIH
jgi:hypothetical protein